MSRRWRRWQSETHALFRILQHLVGPFGLVARFHEPDNVSHSVDELLELVETEDTR